jgi:predicted dehydrogenase
MKKHKAIKSGLNRRAFLKRAVLATGAVSGAKLFSGLNILAATGTIDKLNCVQVGCGIRSAEHFSKVIDELGQNLYAIVEPDPASVKNFLKKHNLDAEKLQIFSDYRVMFDKISKNADAIFVTTPNHHHAKVAMMAMQAGKNVYCEKPVCHDIGEARLLREAAQKYSKVATQMGSQGHCLDGYRSLCELIWSGAIGQVTETHSWTDRANGGLGPRPPYKPAPAGMDWDNWIGPAPYRDYHDDLHPHEWHGWYDFGNGSIGNMACHVLDGVFWALKIEHPASIEVEYNRGGSDERYPLGSRIRWDVPARAGMPPLKAYWYEGLNATTTATPSGTLHEVKGDARNLPPLLLELRKKYPAEKLDSEDSGTLYVGDKGVIYTGTYGGNMHIVSRDKSEISMPPKILPRFPRGKSDTSPIFANFVEACRAGTTDTAVPFEYGAKVTEFAILGNLAQHIGEGKKVEWDGPNMKVTNIPELNEWVKRPYRKGWEI